MIKPEIVAAINKQIQHEQSNSHAYRAVALYFEALSLRGISAWFEKQVADERVHAEKFIEHLMNRGGKVEIGALPAPKNTFDSTLDAVKSVLALERVTTGAINHLYELARKEGDTALEVLLHWYINEQVEEEQWAEELVTLTEQFYKNPGQIFMLDHNWGKRVKG